MTVLAVDIGGTKTVAGIVDGLFSVTDITRQPTQKGRSGLREMLGTCLDHYLSAERSSEISQIGIALPGCLVGTHKTRIRVGTGRQLGQLDGEFDNCDVAELLSTVLPPTIPVTFLNDAQAQCLGGIHQLQLTDTAVGYIGPGTGLGGAFCDLSDGTPQLRTDGHIFDIAIPHPQTGEPVYAESILSGQGIQSTWRMSPITLNTEQGMHQHASLIHQLGVSLATLITQLYSGQPQHLSGLSAWSVDDCQWVATVPTYVIGGSIGTIDPLSTQLLTIARRQLEQASVPIDLAVIPSIQKAPLQGLAQYIQARRN